LIRILRISPRLLALWSVGVVACPGTISAAETEAKKAFNIPAGAAAYALKQFSIQSGSQVIFPEDAIEGAKTKALKGAFTPAEAMDRLLAGTNLKASQDRESGSFAVSRVADPPKEASRPNG
jgi:iron complex outermembrane receptor protein/outer membrane receptor for ferric coprogen and ferric-rhodotorulic acid